MDRVRVRVSGPVTGPGKLAGTALDRRFEILCKLGEGSVGEVFLAKHVFLHTPVAVKIFKPEIARSPGATERFAREAQAVARLGHANIVEVADFGTTADGMAYSVMEYIDGQTLKQAIAKDAPMPVARALAIAAQMASALEAAHARGIVHRDLKPENVFLIQRNDQADFVKIGDFGTAKAIWLGMRGGAPRLGRAGAAFETPEYLAPEQAAGRSDVDHRSDIYSLGILLYEMLTGRVPHKGENALRTLSMQMLDPVASPRETMPGLGISAELEGVLLKALAKHPGERFASMAELGRELARVAEAVALPVSAPAAHGAGHSEDATAQVSGGTGMPGAAGAPGTTGRKRPRSRVLAAVVLVLAIVLLLLALSADP